MNQDAEIFFSALSFIFFIVFAIVVLQVVATVWLYRDAPKYGENPVVWALLSVCFNFVLVVPLYYFFFRSNGKIPCRYCGVWYKPLGKNCPHCGRDRD